MKVYKIPCWEDNYSYILQKENAVLVIDPCDPVPILEALNTLDFDKFYIANTHHHPDHVGGNNALVDHFEAKFAAQIPVFCSERDKDRVPKANIFWPMMDHDVQIGPFNFMKFHTPGHTEGHFSLFHKEESLLFCGDLVFSLGCGRIFEGTEPQLFESHDKLLKFLPLDTLVYGAHEYTLDNLKFTEWAMGLEDSQLRQSLESQYAEKASTIPSTWAFELKYNLFLNCRQNPVREHLTKRMGLSSEASAFEIFTVLRKTRNQGPSPNSFVV